MFNKLLNLYTSVDSAIKEIYRQHPREIMCRPGCADCCHAVFDVSFIEAACLAAYLKENQHLVVQQAKIASEAAVEFEKCLKNNEDLSTKRIRCPLLGDNDLCLAHPFRPVNCRTYGTPTVINGKAHVCGLSGFDNSLRYPSVYLEPLQKSLVEYSTELVGSEFGTRRYPIAWVILRLEYFLPKK